MRISDWSSDVCSSDLRYSYSSSQSATADGIEGPGLLSQCHFGRQALHRGGAVEAVAGFGVVQHGGGVLQHGDGAAIPQAADVGLHLPGGGRPGVDLGGAKIQLQRRVDADRPAGGGTPVTDELITDVL